MLFRTSDGYRFYLHELGGEMVWVDNEVWVKGDMEFNSLELVPGVHWPEDDSEKLLSGSFGDIVDGVWVPVTLCFQTEDGYRFKMSINNNDDCEWICESLFDEPFVCLPSLLRERLFHDPDEGVFGWLHNTGDLILIES